jgi:hypothetical protein
MSKTLGTLDGYTLCGGRTLQVMNLATLELVDLTTSQEITLVDDVLTFYHTEQGTYYYEVYYLLSSYPSIKSSSKAITINVSLAATPPTFVNGGPAFQYFVEENSVLSLNF